MYQGLIVTGIDTDAGKTVAATLLAIGLDAAYWKPIQAGLLPETDREAVIRLSGGKVATEPEAWLLKQPASPHFAAETEGIEINPENILIPTGNGPLVIEGAGGLMVPLNNKDLYIDLFQRWKFPIILVVKTKLGSINHSILSVEALKKRNVPIAGIIFNDGGRPESEEAILHFSQVPLLGKIPVIEELSKGLNLEMAENWLDLAAIRKSIAG